MTLTGQALDEGHNWSHFATGFVRVTYSFTLGIVLFHLPCRPMMSSPWSAAILLLAAAILMVPRLGAWYPLLAITLLMPALVFLGTMIEPGPKLRRGWHLLGRISYPLYVLHAPRRDLCRMVVRQGGPPAAGRRGGARVPARHDGHRLVGRSPFPPRGSGRPPGCGAARSRVRLEGAVALATAGHCPTQERDSP